MEATLNTIEKALVLRDLNVFADVAVESLAALALTAEELHVEAGNIICRGDEPTKHAFVIITGNVVLERHGGITSVLNARQGFGDFSLVPGATYGFTANALDQVHLLRVLIEDVVDTMLDHPEIAIGVVRALALRARELGDRLGELSRRYLDEPGPPEP